MKTYRNLIIRSVLSLLLFYALFHSLLLVAMQFAAVLEFFLTMDVEVAWLISFSLIGLFCAGILRPFILSPIFLALGVELADFSYKSKFKEGLGYAVLIVPLFWYLSYDATQFLRFS